MKQLVNILLAATITFSSCNTPPDLSPGIWRATLKSERGVEIPFNFELSGREDAALIYLINGKERVKIDDITVSKDSVFIRMPVYESEIRAARTSNGLNGKWIKRLADKSVMMDFSARPGVSWRFFSSGKTPGHQVTGRWSTIFVDSEKKDTTVAVGEFEQNESRLTGTFLTSTGDYRFLEGAISDDKIYLSAFDGASAYLFTGTLNNDSTITNGLFFSGASYSESWTAKKDEKAMLPDAYSLTTLKKGRNHIDFNFPDLKGNYISLSDGRFNKKVVIVQFLGSWCPNCMDETAYMVSFYNRFKRKDVEVVGLAYERTADKERSKKNLESLKKRFNITYPILLTGYTNKEVLKSMPALNEFKAFPTTILIDKKGIVRKIHTGFAGPGTGKHYTDFINDFEKEVLRLTKEN